MNVINIDSDIGINHAEKSFLEDVLSSSHDSDKVNKSTFLWLLKKIPIFLISEKSMQKHEKEIKSEYCYEPNAETKPRTEWLGFYKRESSGLFEHTPVIVICTERIAKCVNNDEEYMYLLAKVVVHELAHAKMDFKDQNVKYKSKDTFWRWMEESSANRYVLEVFMNFAKSNNHNKDFSCGKKKSSKALLNFAIDFIKKQPEEYALGYEVFIKRPVLESEWENVKVLLDGKEKVREKNIWLKYMKNNYQNIDKNISKNHYEKIFEGLGAMKVQPLNLDDLKDIIKERIIKESNSCDLNFIDVGKLDDFSSLFYMTVFNGKIDKWDTRNVIYMSKMFYCSETFNQSINHFKVDSLKCIDGMLKNCFSLEPENVDKFLWNCYRKGLDIEDTEYPHLEKTKAWKLMKVL